MAASSGAALALLAVLVLLLGRLAPRIARAQPAASVDVARQATPPAGWVEVERHAGGKDGIEEGADGDALWSVLAVEAELSEVVRAVARRAGLVLEGLELAPNGTAVSARIAARPLDEVLAFLLGSHGLRGELAGGTLRLQAEAEERDALLARAEVAWTELARTDASAARLARGALAEARGDLEGALALYTEGLDEELARPGETSAGTAFERLHRAGLASARRGDWTTAARHFRRLAQAPGAETFRVRAGLALARALLELGDPGSAASTLDGLRVADDACALAERRLLRARARMANAEPAEALRALDAGPVAPLRAVEARSFAVRAEALATLGHPAEAARAWLVFAHEGAGPTERATALLRAVELALAGGDALAALFVCREAAALGLDAEFAAHARSARAELGLDADDARIPFAERLALAEALLDSDAARAVELLEGLERESTSRTPLERALLLGVRARVIALGEGSAAALALLAERRMELDASEARAALDRAAASLLESEGRFDAAADAYEGRYGAPRRDD